jgi:cytochrome c biogenesis protein
MAMRGTWNELWKILNSTRFVIVLIVLLAIAAIAGIALGELFPTDAYGAEAYYRARFGDTAFIWMARLGVFAPFRSPWFHSLLFLLAASLVACSVNRLRTTVRAALGITFRRSASELLSLKHHAQISFATGAAPVEAGEIQRVLRKHGYAVRMQEQLDRTAIAASRGGISRFGPYLTHLGLLCLIAGGMLSGLLGHSEMVWLAPGESWPGMGRGFTIRLVDFEIPRNEQGQILQYRATVEVADPMRGDRVQVISVNHPLRHAGVSFYQTSYEALPGRRGAAPRYATGLMARTSPGSGAIWIGFAVTTLGLLLSFYITHRRLWVVVDARAITLAGISSGNRASFERELTTIAGALSGLTGRIAA